MYRVSKQEIKKIYELRKKYTTAHIAYIKYKEQGNMLGKVMFCEIWNMITENAQIAERPVSYEEATYGFPIETIEFIKRLRNEGLNIRKVEDMCRIQGFKIFHQDFRDIWRSFDDDSFSFSARRDRFIRFLEEEKIKGNDKRLIKYLNDIIRKAVDGKKSIEDKKLLDLWRKRNDIDPANRALIAVYFFIVEEEKKAKEVIEEVEQSIIVNKNIPPEIAQKTVKKVKNNIEKRIKFYLKEKDKKVTNVEEEKKR